MHFWFPMWRQFITWLGGVPATPENFKRMLKQGCSVGVVVGGVAGDTTREQIELLCAGLLDTEQE